MPLPEEPLPVGSIVELPLPVDLRRAFFPVFVAEPLLEPPRVSDSADGPLPLPIPMSLPVALLPLDPL